MTQALAVWEDVFGLERVIDRPGSDPALASTWSIQAEDINRQVLLRTSGQRHGMVHLVEFADPEAPVRKNAKAFDLVPKNLDLHVRDLPSKVAALRAQGFTFRTDRHSTIEAPNGVTFHEIHMPSHDHTNLVLLEVVGDELSFTKRGYAGVGLLVTTIPDVATEKQFYLQALGLEVTSENQLAGPEIERMIGLPQGASLNIAILGKAGAHFGSMELVEYRNTNGENLYSTAKPKATGILMSHYQVEDLANLENRWVEKDIAFDSYPASTTVFGSGPKAVLTTPAGFRIEVHQES